MLYLFTGNSSVLLNETVKKWKTKWLDQFGDLNLLHLKDLSIVDNNFLAENLFTSGFLGSKKLIILDIDDDLDEEKIEFFLKSFTKVPEENLVIFSYINPDKRTKFFKELEKVAEKREFIVGENNIFSTLQKKYANKISPSAISLLLRYKANSLEKIVNEIEKLSILYPFIDEKEVKENIVPELEESIFQVIDDILNEKIKEAIEKIITITNEINIYAFYNNLLANLRVSVFIMKLKKEGKNSVEIGNILALGNRSFLVNKNYKILPDKLEKLFIGLVDLDKKMKTGNMIGTEDNDFLVELENVLLLRSL